MYSDEIQKAMLNGERVQITGVCSEYRIIGQ